MRENDPAPAEKVLDLKAATAELLAMTLFVILGCGTACGNGAYDGATRLVVALAFGMSIMALAYSMGHHSGGHINCAVTLSLVIGGEVPWYQGIANVIAQIVGSFLGATVLCAMFPCSMDMTTTLGTNIVSDSYGIGNAFVGEVVMTFFLCYVVWETAVSSYSKVGQNACIAIGFTVFIAHLVLLPIDGCSINPTRSLGPAIVSEIRGCANHTEGGLEDLWIMWLGPLLGGTLAALIQKPFLRQTGHTTKVEAMA